MTKKHKEGVLSEAQKLKYQRRLRHFFQDYKYRNGLQAKEVAETLGYTWQKFSALESDAKPHSRFVSSLDFLATIGALENMSVSDFVSYLDGREDRFKSEQPGQLNRPLFAWEKTLLEAFDPLEIKIRKKFLELCKEANEQGKEKLETLIQIANVLKDKDETALKNVLVSLQSLTS